MKPTHTRVAVLVAVAGLFGLGAWLGLFDALRHPAEIAGAVRATGAWGALAFVVVSALFEAIGVLGIFFLLPAALVWPPPVAFALGMVSSMLGSWLGFVLARGVGRSFFERRAAEGSGRMRRFEAGLAKNAFVAITLMRLVFFIFPPITWALGLSKVRTGPFLAGTFVGMLPGVFCCTYLGSSLFGWLAGRPPWVWALLLALAALGVAGRKLRSPG